MHQSTIVLVRGARVFSPGAAILESEKTLGTRLTKVINEEERTEDFDARKMEQFV